MFMLKYKYMQKGNTKSGFTLIELSFAIAFISVLLITIALITNEIVSLYRKGHAMKTVNQVGRDLIDDFTASITASPPANIVATFCNGYSADAKTACINDSGQHSIYYQYYADVAIRNSDAETKNVPIGGVFCTGKYSYVWNTGYVYGEAYTNADGEHVQGLSVHIPKANIGYTTTDPVGNDGLWFTSDGANGSKKFRLLKFEDTKRAICSFPITDPGDNYGGARTYTNVTTPVNLSTGSQEVRQGFEITYSLTSEPVELISSSDTSLALYDLVVFTPAQVTSTNRLFYSASFILGTLDGSVDIMTASDFCKTPDSYRDADFSYCAVNKFNFSTQASGL